MKSFKEYLNESIVDQYKAVRAAAIPGDELMRSTYGTAWPSQTNLVSSLPRWPEDKAAANIVNSAEAQQPVTDFDSWTWGHYDPPNERAITNLTPSVSSSLDDRIDTNSHELAHQYQHQAQMKKQRGGLGAWLDTLRERKPRLSDKGFISKSYHDAIKMKPTRSTRRKWKRTEKSLATGYMDPYHIPDNNRIDLGNASTVHQQYNSDNEINSRIIGYAGRYLDRRLDPDKPDTTAHMEELADHLFRSQRSDIPNTRRHVQTAIENVRAESLANFRKSQEALPGIEPKSVRKAMHQYGRLIQYHEEQLPTDIHTPEGRDSFIRTHGSAAMGYNI